MRLNARNEILGLLAWLLLLPTPGWAGVIASIERPEPYDLRVVGFELPRNATVRIEARGLGLRATSRLWVFRFRDQDQDRKIAYAWLLDARTREPVWIMDSADSETDRDEPYALRADERLDLPAGRYELYYFSGVGWLGTDSDRNQANGSWWESLFGSDRPSREQIEDALDSGHVTVSAEGLTERDAPAFEVTGALPESLILQQRLGDSTFRVSGFKLDRVASLRVYGLVEKVERQRASADFGWIIDAVTREVVWSANDADLHEAGGAAKNRMFDEELRLQPGRYLVHYGTDSSHSYERFNAAPPHDPLNWGITILPGDGFNAESFVTFDPAANDDALIEITEVGNDQSIERAFRMDGAGVLQVLALGEYGSDEDQFYDHGWISDASTGKAVWRMTGRNTTGAGGAEKNRRFDGLVELPAGEYVVHYVTDGSHSFDQWNQEAPFEPDRWGITIRAGSGFDPALFKRR